MSNWLTKWLDDNKTCYMVCFTDNKSRTSKEAFDNYNGLVSDKLKVIEENYSWQLLSNGVIKSWVFTCDKSTKNKIIQEFKESSTFKFLSEGTTKRKFKKHFHFGLD